MADAIRKVLRKALLSLELPTEADGTVPEAHRRRADEHVAGNLMFRPEDLSSRVQRASCGPASGTSGSGHDRAGARCAEHRCRARSDAGKVRLQRF